MGRPRKPINSDGDTRKRGRERTAAIAKASARAADDSLGKWEDELEQMAREARQDALEARDEAARLRSLAKKTARVREALNRAEKREDVKNEKFLKLTKELERLRREGAHGAGQENDLLAILSAPRATRPLQ